MKTFCLVACSAKKLSGVYPAKKLYISDLFKKSVAYAEALGGEWLILSAMYGVIEPDDQLAAYNKTLNGMSKAQRARWARAVMIDLSLRIKKGDRVVILAGKRYREDLVPALERLGAAVEVPLENLGIGMQLQKLTVLVAKPLRGKSSTLKYFDD